MQKLDQLPKENCNNNNNNTTVKALFNSLQTLSDAYAAVDFKNIMAEGEIAHDE